MFDTVSWFYISLIFLCKARSIPVEWSPMRGSTLLSSRLACKYYTSATVTNSVKHTSLLLYIINNCRKKFYDTGLIKAFIIKRSKKILTCVYSTLEYTRAVMTIIYRVLDLKASTSFISSTNTPSSFIV